MNEDKYAKPIKNKVRVVQTRNTTVFTRSRLSDDYVQTVQSTKHVIFKGSRAAFNIWKETHLIPGGSVIDYQYNGDSQLPKNSRVAKRTAEVPQYLE